jgi:hypothetical protein
LALFESKSEELAFQEFQPGSTNLLPAAIANLDVLASGLYARPELQLEIEGSTNPQTDLEALRRAESGKKLLVQKWNAAANLFSAGNTADTTEGPAAQSSQKAFTSAKGASALRSAVAHWPTTPIRSNLTENHPVQTSLRTFADDKGATALMLIFAPGGAAEDTDLEMVEIAPGALPKLASDRARNVKAYLVQTGKVEAQRITESAQGVSSKGSRVYLQLQ